MTHPAGFSFIMAGGGDEMAVTGVKIEIIEALESRERIGHFTAHVNLGFGEHITQQCKPSLALPSPLPTA
jgi:hypothetical protein